MDSRKSFILFAANQVLSNQEMMHRHMWKTQPCQFGIDCDRNVSDWTDKPGNKCYSTRENCKFRCDIKVDPYKSECNLKGDGPYTYLG